MSIARTESGQLQYGIEYEGSLHFDVEMRLTTVKDNIEALERCGAESGMRITMAMYVASIVRLGSIPKEALTFEFLMENMAEPDFDVLASVQEQLKKKRRQSSSSSSTTVSPSSSSVNTASTPTPSAG